MRDLTIYDLGDAGLAYVREHLADTNLLCSALLEIVTNDLGDVFTVAPPGTTQLRLNQFTCGGLLPENLEGIGAVCILGHGTFVSVNSLIEDQTKLLRRTMLATPGATCIVDDFNPRWSDQPPPIGPGLFGIGEEVYHLITRDHSDEDLTAAVACGNTLWHGVAAVCGDAPSLSGSRESNPAEIHRCATSAVLLTCTAYDGEGFVAWRRRIS
jgi:hypothetical protein